MTSTALVTRRESIRRRRTWTLFLTMLTAIVWSCALLAAVLPLYAQGDCAGIIGAVTPIGTFANIRSSPENLGDRNDVGDLKNGSQLNVTRLVNGWYETCRKEYIGSSVVRFVVLPFLSTPTRTVAPTPTRITPVPTLTELIVFVKVFIKYGNNESVDSGIFPWSTNQPVSCQLVRVDNFPQPSPTVRVTPTPLSP